MKRAFPFLFGLLLAAATARASEVVVPPEARVANVSPGCCTWACLETQGKLLGVSSLDGLTLARRDQALKKGQEVADRYGLSVEDATRRYGDHGGTPARVREELRSRKVEFEMQSEGDYSIALIERSLAAGRPVSVSFMDYEGPGEHHACLLTGLTADGVWFIDPNSPAVSEKKPPSWWRRHWTGRVIAIKAPPALPVVARPARVAPPLAGLLAIPDPAHAAGLRSAMSRGRPACKEYLVREMRFSPDEAEATVERLWSRK